MALNLGDLHASLTLDAGQFIHSLADAQKGMFRFAHMAETVTGAVTDMAKALFSVGFEAAQSMEEAEIAIGNMAGSAEEAAKFMEDLKKFTIETPFNFDKVTDEVRKLQGAGIAMEDMIPLLTVFGDAVSATGKGAVGLKSLVKAFTDMRGAGKIMASDMNQLVNAGFNAWQMLADHLGVTVAQAREKVSKEFVASKDFWQHLMKNMMSTTGGQMHKMAMTLGGMWESFKDKSKIAIAEGIEPFREALKPLLLAFGVLAADFGAFITPLIGGLVYATKIATGLLITFNAMPQSFRYAAYGLVGIIVGLAGVTVAATTAFFALSTVVSAMLTIGSVVAAVGLPAIIAIGAGLAGLMMTGLQIMALYSALAIAWATNWNGMRDVVNGVIDSVVSVVSSGMDLIASAINYVWDFIVSSLGRLATALTYASMAFNVIAIAADVAFNFIMTGVNAVWEVIISVFSSIASFVGQVFAAIQSMVGTVVSYIAEAFNAITAPIVAAFDTAKAAAVSVIAVISGGLSSAAAVAESAFTSLKNTVVETISSIVNAVYDLVQIAAVIESTGGVSGPFTDIADQIGASVDQLNNTVAALEDAKPLTETMKDKSSDMVTALTESMTSSISDMSTSFMDVVNGPLKDLFISFLPEEAGKVLADFLAGKTSLNETMRKKLDEWANQLFAKWADGGGGGGKGDGYAPNTSMLTGDLKNADQKRMELAFYDRMFDPLIEQYQLLKNVSEESEVALERMTNEMETHFKKVAEDLEEYFKQRKAKSDFTRDTLVGGMEGEAGAMAGSAIAGAAAFGGPIGALIGIALEFIKNLEAFQNAVAQINEFISRLTGMFNEALSSFMSMDNTLWDIIFEVLDLIKALSDMIGISEGLTSLFSGMKAALTPLLDMMKAITDIFQDTGTSFKGFARVAEAFTFYLWVITKAVGLVVTGLFTVILGVWQGILEFAQWFLKTIGMKKKAEELQTTIDNNNAALDQLTGSLEDMWNKNYNDARAVDEHAAATEKSTEAIDNMTASLTNVPVGYKVALTRFQSALAETLEASNVSKDPYTSGGYSGLGMTHTSNKNSLTVPHLASGGIVKKKTLAVVGEAGPEAVVPLGKGGGMPGGTTIIIENLNVMANDPFELQRQLDKVADRKSLVMNGRTMQNIGSKFSTG